ncbi:MAG: YggT family protein [Patescibacteria group bacterium]
MNTSTFIVNTVDFLSSAIFVLIFIRIILSWIPSAKNPLTQFVFDVTEPILKPIRRFNPKGSPLDLSPIIVIILIEIIRNVILRML